VINFRLFFAGEFPNSIAFLFNYGVMTYGDSFISVFVAFSFVGFIFRGNGFNTPT
jgi:hypothetical protein